MNRVQRKLVRQGGFTLLELLVAIMILTLLMTASLGSVRIASRSWAAGQERADMTEEMRSVADFLRRQFAQLPPLTIGEGSDTRLAFAAGEKELRFVAPGPQYSFGAGLFLYTLAGESIDGNESLTLRYAPFDPGNESFVEPVSSDGMILAWGFEDITFHYYGSQTDDDSPAWHRHWSPDAEFYPLAVRIRTRSTPTGDGWPDLVYRLRSGERT
jgi:general secretion pathway protein J